MSTDELTHRCEELTKTSVTALTQLVVIKIVGEAVQFTEGGGEIRQRSR